MTDRITPKDVDAIISRSDVKGVYKHTFGFAKAFTLWRKWSFEIGSEGNKLCINKESLARYICEKYVADKKPRQFKEIVRRAIDAALTNESCPTNIDDFVQKVVENVSSPEIQEALHAKQDAEKTEYHVVNSNDYRRFTNIVGRLGSLPATDISAVPTEPISQRKYAPIRLERAVIEKVVRKKFEEANVRLVEVVKDLKLVTGLPNILQGLVSKPPSFETYEAIIKDLNARTKGDIPIRLDARQEVLKTARTLSSGLIENQKILDSMKKVLAEIQVQQSEQTDILQSASKAVRDAGEVHELVLQSKAGDFIGEQKKLTSLIGNCRQATESLRKAVDISKVEEMYGTLELFGYNTSQLRTACTSQTSIEDKFADVSLALRELGFSIRADAPLVSQIENVLVERSEFLVSEIGKSSSGNEIAAKKIEENLRAISAWTDTFRSSLSSLDIRGFPNQQQKLIEKRDVLLSLIAKRIPTKEEIANAKSLVEAVVAWKGLSDTTMPMFETFQRLKGRTETFSGVNDKRWETYITAKKEIEGVLSDADAKVNENPQDIMRGIQASIDTFSQSLKQFESVIDGAVREKCQIVKKNIKEMYLFLSPAEGTRSKLPHWGEWIALKGQNVEEGTGGKLDSLLQRLRGIEEEVKIPYELVLSKQTSEAGEQSGFAASAASSMNRRRFIKEIMRLIYEYKSGQDLSALLDQSVEGYFEEIKRFPDLPDNDVSVLLNNFSSKNPKKVPEEEFLNLVAKAISKNASRADVVIPMIQTLVETSESNSILQSLLDKLSNTLESDLESALISPDSALLQGVLHRMIMTTHQSQGKTEAMIRLLGEAIKTDATRVAQVVSALTTLFDWFKEDSTEMREGIRALSEALDVQKEVESFTFPVEVSEELSQAIQLLAEQLSLKNKPEGHWDASTFHTALVFHAAPDTSKSPDVKVSDMSLTALDLGLERLTEVVGNAPVHPLFVGTEWKFMAGNYSEFIATLDTMSDISCRHHGVTFIPGSIGWFDPETNLCFNTLPIFENGRLVSLYSKRHEKQDMDTIGYIFPPEKTEGMSDEEWDTLCSKNRASKRWAAHEDSETFDAFIRNTCVLDSGLALGTEICNDHVNNTVQGDYQRESPHGQGLDLHLVIAHGSQLGLPRLAVRAGGAVGYIDHSGDGVTTAGRVSDTKETFAAKEARSNSNREALGAFVTHQADLGDVSPVFSDKKALLAPQSIPSSTPSSILEAIGQPAALHLLIEYVKENTSQLFPSEMEAKASFSTQEGLAKGLTQALTRYTFAGEADVEAFLGVLKGDSSLGDYRTPFLRCLSSMLHRPIVLYTDLASVDREVFMPDRSRPVGIPKDPIELGFSFANKTFFTPIWKDSVAYQETNKLSSENCALWEVQMNALAEQLQKTDEMDGAALEALKREIAVFRSIYEKGNIGQQRAFSEFAERINRIEEMIVSTAAMATDASALKAEANAVFQQWSEGREIHFSGFHQACEKYLQGRKAQISIPIEHCVEVFDTLEKFQNQSRGFRGTLGMMGVWIDPGTKRLTFGPVYLKQDTTGIAEELLGVLQSMISLLPQVPEEKRSQMIDCLEYLSGFYSGDEGLKDSVDAFIQALQSSP